MSVPPHNVAAVESSGFEVFNFSPFLSKTIETVGYVTPTPIQAQAIPLLLAGHDLIGLAQTGTGKTAAFVLPILQRLSASKSRGSKVLVLAPTRELVEQIRDVVTLLGPRTGVKSTTVYGGVSHQRQIRDLSQRPDIIVACPGRLLDHIRGRTIDLSTIEYLVLDEADRMLDMGFLPDIKKIISKLPQDRQTMLFSATMPKEIELLSREVLRDPQMVRVKVEAPVAAVTHTRCSIQPGEKLDALVSWLREQPEALAVVFTKMKHTAKKISEKLDKLGFDATSLHGNLSQAKRLQALNGFRQGDFRILVATDIAARGIDVEGITHVVNYDMPDTLDAYIHRTGRAGRASRTGTAIAFVTREDRGMVRSIEKWLGVPLSEISLTLNGASAEGRASANEDAVKDVERREERPERMNREERRPRGSRWGDQRSRNRGGARQSGPERQRQGRPRRFEQDERRAGPRSQSEVPRENRGNSREWQEWDAKRFSGENSPSRSAARDGAPRGPRSGQQGPRFRGERDRDARPDAERDNRGGRRPHARQQERRDGRPGVGAGPKGRRPNFRRGARNRTTAN